MASPGGGGGSGGGYFGPMSVGGAASFLPPGTPGVGKLLIVIWGVFLVVMGIFLVGNHIFELSWRFYVVKTFLLGNAIHIHLTTIKNPRCQGLFLVVMETKIIFLSF